MNNLRGAKIIYQESKATQPSHLYFLQKDANYCEVIVTSESGVKRKLNINVDLSNYYTKTETFSQTQINNLLNNKQNNLGYTPENIANKSDSYTSNSSTTYASSKALVEGLSTKLDKGTYTGTAKNLKNDIDGKANISHTHDISSITNLQNSLDTITNDIDNLEGINYVWSPTNRNLTLFDRGGNQLSQVSLVSLDDEGTSLKYNDITLSLELYNEADELLTSIPVSAFVGSVGTQLQLNSNQLHLKDSQGNILSTVTLQIDSKTTNNVVATTTVGAINAGEAVPAGTNIQELTELLLNKTFYPTFVNQTFGLTNNAGLREVGSSFNVTLIFNFNRGQILGKLDNGIWNPTMLQDYRAGIATSYLLNGVSGSNNSASFNVTTILGNNNLSGSVTYETGVQPKDSKNNNFDNPLPSGTSPIQSTSFEGIYPYFYYKSLSPITPAIMQSAIANGQATKVLASSTGTITIPFAANGEYIAVAYPATSTTKIIWYVNALDNGEIPGGLLGAANTLPCNSPTGLWNNVNFKIHVSAGLITQPNPIQLKNS